jgi:hypothetical protein
MGVKLKVQPLSRTEHSVNDLVNVHIRQPPHEPSNVVDPFRSNLRGGYGCLHHLDC